MLGLTLNPSGRPLPESVASSAALRSEPARAHTTHTRTTEGDHWFSAYPLHACIACHCTLRVDTHTQTLLGMENRSLITTQPLKALSPPQTGSSKPSPPNTTNLVCLPPPCAQSHNVSVPFPPHHRHRHFLAPLHLTRSPHPKNQTPTHTSPLHPTPPTHTHTCDEPVAVGPGVIKLAVVGEAQF